MSTIYLDQSVTAASDAADRLAHLVDAGHDLVLVAATSATRPGPMPWAGRTEAVPQLVERGTWYVTADPSTCRDRQPGLRTLLIGPRAASPRPTRCDSTARDLRDAVLEILRADAMG